MFYLLNNFHWEQLLQPQFYVENGGLWLLLFVVFAETGLFVGFFLPGDSLLFVAGIYAHKLDNGGPGLSHQFLKLFGLGGIQNEAIDLLALWGLISFFGVLGNSIGYWTGRRVGPAMYNWKDQVFFKKVYLERAHEFYKKHGSVAIIAARFLPFIRTFAPIVAGIVRMERHKFHICNIIGSVAWVFSMVFSGYFLQKWILREFDFDLKDHLEVIVFGIVVITTAPIIVKLFSRSRKNMSDSPNSNL